MKKLKDGWKNIHLKDILSDDIRNGYSPLPAENETGYWVLGLGALTDNGLNKDEIKPVHFEERVEKSLLKFGDFLVSRSNTPDKVGRSILFKNEIINCSYPDLMMRFRINETLAYPYFIEQYLKTKSIRAYFSNSASGSSKSMVKINKSILEKTPLLLPPLEEQIQIAETLSTWDKAIQTTEKLLENSRRQKKVLMQRLLNGKDWKKVKLGNVADMSSGGTPKSNIAEYYNGDILWVSIADMTTQGKYITRTEKTISKLGLENSSAKLYPENTILYAMYASIGECSIATKPVTSSQAILGIRPKKELHFEYLYFYLSSLKDKMKLQGQQGTQSNLNSRMVKEFDILLPSFEEQQKIAEILSTADQEIETLQRKLECLKLEKGALMQRLL